MHCRLVGILLKTFTMDRNVPSLPKNMNKPEAALNNTKTNCPGRIISLRSKARKPPCQHTAPFLGKGNLSLCPITCRHPNTEDHQVIKLSYPFNIFEAGAGLVLLTGPKRLLLDDHATNCAHRRTPTFEIYAMTTKSLICPSSAKPAQTLSLCPNYWSHIWTRDNSPTFCRILPVCKTGNRHVIKLSHPHQITTSRSPLSQQLDIHLPHSDLCIW